MSNQLNFVLSGPMPENVKYTTLGIVGTQVDNTDSVTGNYSGCKGCGGCGAHSTNTRVYVSIEETYNRAAKELLKLAKNRGGNAVINASFEHRVSVEALQTVANIIFKNKTETEFNQVFELVGYGTAVLIFE
jgi:uncharacterized protein YbjQ (UPF0145 family)